MSSSIETSNYKIFLCNINFFSTQLPVPYAKSFVSNTIFTTFYNAVVYDSFPWSGQEKMDIFLKPLFSLPSLFQILSDSDTQREGSSLCLTLVVCICFYFIYAKSFVSNTIFTTFYNAVVYDSFPCGNCEIRLLDSGKIDTNLSVVKT